MQHIFDTPTVAFGQFSDITGLKLKSIVMDLVLALDDNKRRGDPNALGKPKLYELGYALFPSSIDAVTISDTVMPANENVSPFIFLVASRLVRRIKDARLERVVLKWKRHEVAPNLGITLAVGIGGNKVTRKVIVPHPPQSVGRVKHRLG